MKKAVVILLSMFIILSSVSSAFAYTPLPPEEHIAYLFVEYYLHQANDESLTIVECLEMSDCPGSSFGNDYYLVRFTSENAEQESYFKRFGSKNEYYESSDVTNKVFESGIAVFVGSVYNSEHKNNFYSLEDIALMNIEAIEYISDLIGVDYVGQIGDTDGDNSVTIFDATAIQRHLAELIIIENARLNISDVNQDNVVNILDATAIQRKLAEIDAPADTPVEG